MPEMHQEDSQARRNYWVEQLELGHEFVEQLIAHQVQESGEGFASLVDAARDADVELMFSGSKIAGDLDRVFYLRESLVADVMEIARQMNRRGWILKIEDAYRSIEMQTALVRKPEVFDSIVRRCVWENGGSLPSVEHIFRRATIMVANIPKIGTHMSGSAIDISVYKIDSGDEVWRGAAYLEVSELTPMRSPYIDQEHLRNRLEITEVMESRGFMHFPQEFWHYNKGDAGAHILTGNSSPAPFGPVHFDRDNNTVQPVADPCNPLIPISKLRLEIDAAMERMKQ